MDTRGPRERRAHNSRIGARCAARHRAKTQNLWIDAIRALHLARRGTVGQRSRTAAKPDNAAERAEAALDAAGAQMLAARRLIQGQLEVAFRFLGERFIAVVDELSLQVYDAGICLSGADREVNLDSLPSVIREAVNSGRLVITRR